MAAMQPAAAANRAIKIENTWRIAGGGGGCQP